uniref:Uncharacterized protein n=1 Tax=Medicago truncatula TaxID=3880 RepID=A2Q1C1_MEDTR|nr:hypothetical protein MtrDRAFT_AC148762g24v2 [Medicago truncatula]
MSSRASVLIGWEPPAERGDGEWLRGFAKNIGLCGAYVAELWGVF